MRKHVLILLATAAVLTACSGSGSGGGFDPSRAGGLTTPPVATQTPTPKPIATSTASPAPTPSPTHGPLVVSPNPIYLGGSYPTTVRVTVSEQYAASNAVFALSKPPSCEFLGIATVTPKTAPAPKATFTIARLATPGQDPQVTTHTCDFVINDQRDGTDIIVPVTAYWPSPSPSPSPTP